MKNLRTVSALLFSALVSASVAAADATVEFKDPENYRDIEAVNALQERFQQKLFTGLEEHFAKLAALLPDGNALAIVVTDLDITGRVEPTFGMGGTSHMRVVERIDYPRIEFTYSYTDANGSELNAGAVNIKDIGFENTRRQVLASGRDALYYEKQLLNGWFEETFGINTSQVR